MSELKDKPCTPCEGLGTVLGREVIDTHLSALHADWVLGEGPQSISRRFGFKGFAKAVYLANLAAYLGDREGHHPDIAFGWGYCTITFTSHDLGGLSENDFICAARLDALVS